MGDVPKRHAPILFPSDQETRTGDGKKRKTDEFPRTPVPRRNAGDSRPRRDDVICPKPSLPKHSNTNPKSSSRDGFKSAAKGFEPQKDVPFEKPADRQIGKSGLQVRVVFDKSHRWTRDEVREQGESVVYQQGLLPNLAELVSLNLTESERRLLIWHFRICCFCHDEIPVEARAGCHSYNCGCLAHQFGHDGCSSSERTSSAVTHSAQLCTLEFQNRLISDFIKKKISSEADDDVEKCINAEMRASFPNLTSGFSKRFDSSEELVEMQQKRGETAKRSMARESKKSMTMAIGAKPTVPQRTVMKKVEGTVDDCILISSDSEAELCPPEKKKRMEEKPTVESREETEIDLVLLRALNEEICRERDEVSKKYERLLSTSLVRKGQLQKVKDQLEELVQMADSLVAAQRDGCFAPAVQAITTTVKVKPELVDVQDGDNVAKQLDELVQRIVAVKTKIEEADKIEIAESVPYKGDELVTLTAWNYFIANFQHLHKGITALYSEEVCGHDSEVLSLKLDNIRSLTEVAKDVKNEFLSLTNGSVERIQEALSRTPSPSVPSIGSVTDMKG